MSAQQNAALPAGLVIGGYRIVKKISTGGFSIVYLALDETNTPVAIKEYLPSSLVVRREGELEPSIVPQNLATFRVGLKCFFEEGRALARISHPNVVRVLNFFRANGTVYMVMVYESGRSLQELIIRRRDTPGRDYIIGEGTIRRIFSQVLNGLREVHANKILHLDIKPANIYLRSDATPILLDFGAARQTLNPDEDKLYPMYTPGFAPPELHVKEPSLGPWSDIYSVGAAMFACLSGSPPQAADARRQADKMPSAIRQYRAHYSPELLDLINLCLKLDPLERPQSVFSVQKLLLAEVVRHEPASFTDRLKRMVARSAGRGEGGTPPGSHTEPDLPTDWRK
ncbi:serine/threonine-protein kinase [Derxia lacustris]|uniref:serine/threonine-protein kinase n=1 Tax=Derxia lacustris TaxID=764842 RepID=UPI000A1771BA|nr:serine/threonine-protein kinase [Derxia lacustris]